MHKIYHFGNHTDDLINDLIIVASSEDQAWYFLENYDDGVMRFKRDWTLIGVYNISSGVKVHIA